MSALLDIALAYQQRGLHPIVERPNSKLPAEAAWQTTIGRSEDDLRVALGSAPEGSGIGTVTGAGFIVIDCDVRPEKNGLDALASLPPLPSTLTSLTPSGGRHFFFKTSAPIRNSVSKLAPGIDVRGIGGQVVLPPTVIDGRAYSWLDEGQGMAELPPAWVELLAPTEAPGPAAGALAIIQSPTDTEHEARRRAAYLAALNERSVQGAGGNAVMMRVAGGLKGMSRTEDEALAAMLEWNERLADPLWSELELRRAIARSNPPLGATLDRRESPADAPVAVGAEDAQVAWVEAMQSWVARTPDRRSWALRNPLTEKAAERSMMRIGVDAATAREQMKLLPSSPLPNVFGVDCRPFEGAVFRDEHGNLTLNTWVPPTIKAAELPFPVLDEVLGFLTAGDKVAKRWLMNWLAFAAQNPARMLRTVPVFYGSQRTGKSLLARAMSELMGPENCTTIRNEDIKSRFTSGFVTKLFVTVGEIEAGEVAHATSTLKYLTGEPTLKFEEKGASAFDVTNRIKMLATSNQTLPVNVEGDADSRWVLFRQLTAPSPDYAARMDSLFDQATNAWNAKGRAELAGLLHFLLAFNVDVTMARTVLKTQARDAAVEGSKSSVTLWCDAVEDAGSLDALWARTVPDYERGKPVWLGLDVNPRGHGRKGLVELAAAHALYVTWAKANGFPNATGTGRFPAELERQRPTWVILGGTSRVNVYADGGARRRVVCIEGMPRDIAARPHPYNAPFFRDPGEPPAVQQELPGDPLAEARAILGRRTPEARA